VSSCGGGRGGTPSTGGPLPTPNPSLAPILSVSVVDGAGAPVTDAAVTVDGLAWAPRTTGSHVYDLERALVGRTLGVDRDDFLFHQALVPAQDLAVDLFQVPDRGSKAWVRAMLYDAAFSPGGTLVRLQRAVSIVRGASVPDADWERVRSVWEQAAGRMSEVTGTAFRVVQQPEPGTVVYSEEQLISRSADVRPRPRSRTTCATPCVPPRARRPAPLPARASLHSPKQEIFVTSS
jgi:hypothetical protein